MQRKIFNFESQILIDETIKHYGYHPEQYGAASAKFVIASCRFCGLPAHIRKCFFKKSGSACHKECRLKEQSISGSPFANKEVQEKSKRTNMERYGVEHASQNKDIAAKISQTKRTDKHQDRVKKTNLGKYGVENPFQSEDIKQQIKATLLEKYNADHPLRSEIIKERIANTNLERYGVKNPLQNKDVLKKKKDTNISRFGCENPQQNAAIKEKTVHSFSESIKTNDHYRIINTLRDDQFWQRLAQQISLKQACTEFDIDYQSVTSRLLHEEFREKYYQLYTFPKQQKQKEIYELIVSLGLKPFMNDRSIISPLELDIYIPSHKFAIEFNGSYWHSEAVLAPKEAQKKHITKTRLCSEKNVRLFHIFEHTWNKRKNQILNFIKSILGVNNTKIPARKCKITNTPCKEFMEQNHIQGHGNRTIQYFNLEHDGQIVGSMTAAAHHRQNAVSGTIVLNRLCFADGINVQGGSSKLFKAFIGWARDSGYNQIVSWSDNFWTEGNIYTVLGFKLEKEHGPDYFYWDAANNRYVSKQSQKKSNTNCPSDLTEREWCLERGLYRIWDCGKRLWMYNLSVALVTEYFRINSSRPIR